MLIRKYAASFLPRVRDLERVFLVCFKLLSKFGKFHFIETFVAVIEATKLCKIRPEKFTPVYPLEFINKKIF